MNLAPNGKQSNLNEEQWHLVRTPEFKRWFGDWEKLAYAKLKDAAMDDVTLERLSKNVSKAHAMWLADEGRNGHVRKNTDIRTIHIPPRLSYSGWNIEKYKNKWNII